MLSLEPVIKNRLNDLAALTGWRVSGACDDVNRAQVPAADVRMANAAAGDVRRTAAQLEPRWTVSLAVRRGEDVAEQLGVALSSVIETLHNWPPGQVGGRQWTPLQLIGVAEANFSTAGLVGYEVVFSTTAMFDGQP
jgi:hypothetical protein